MTDKELPTTPEGKLEYWRIGSERAQSVIDARKEAGVADPIPGDIGSALSYLRPLSKDGLNPHILAEVSSSSQPYLSTLVLSRDKILVSTPLGYPSIPSMDNGKHMVAELDFTEAGNSARIWFFEPNIANSELQSLMTSEPNEIEGLSDSLRFQGVYRLIQDAADSYGK